LGEHHSHERGPSGIETVCFSEDLTGNGEPNLVIRGQGEVDPDSEARSHRSVHISQTPSSGTLDLASESQFVVRGDEDWYLRGADCIGDVNGDGWADLGVNSEYHSSLSTGEYLPNYFGGLIFFGPLSADQNRSPTDPDIFISTAGNEDVWAIQTYSMVNTGDVNGDGFNELLLASIDGHSMVEGGEVYLFEGPIDSDLKARRGAIAIIRSDHRGMGVGWTQQGSDLDGDGLSDLILGTPFYPDALASWALDGPGRVSIFKGPIEGFLEIEEADTHLQGETSDGDDNQIRFGYDLESTADFNGDGYLDLLIAAPHIKASEGGEVMLFEGPIIGQELHSDQANATLVGDEDNLYAGFRLGTGDFDGDGESDVLVGSYNDGLLLARASGKGSQYEQGIGAWIQLGPLAGTMELGEADYRIVKDESGNSTLGSTLDVLGDLDQDGTDDFILGDPHRAEAHVFLSGVALTESGPY